LHHLHPLTQIDYDHLLWACDLNFVRGEDSLVRALWARKPFVWHIYPQDDGAHIGQIECFSGLGPSTQRSAEHAHAMERSHCTGHLTRNLIDGWRDAGPWVQQLADTLGAQPDLVSQLLGALPADEALNPSSHARTGGEGT
jgi:hypothetical protein